MPTKQYPFIDVAVHERVRVPFARGEAVVLFSPDLQRVLWSNGRGAGLFGHASIYDFLDAGPPHGDISFRQLEASAAQLRAAGSMRSFLMRIGAGFRSMPVNARVERIAVRQGDEAILFSAPVAGEREAARERAIAMLSGFDDPDTHMAVLDGDGEVIAASGEFDSLGMDEETRRLLVNAAGRNGDWLVKRPVPTGKGHLPAAIGRISADPALHLLFAVETIIGNLDADSGLAEQHGPKRLSGSPQAETLPEIADHAPGTAPDRDAAPDRPKDDEHHATAKEPAPDGQAHVQPLNEELTPKEADAPARPAVSPQAEPGDFVFNSHGRPVRFVWKIDAEGRFREISGEFAEAVGPRAAAIVGEAFTDVAGRYGLDPDGKIGELLRRRDTWSGKTILWPVEGTSLVVPVDLAALPTYSRNREFDGFRGFGIVRIADAVEDPKALGLSFQTPAPAEDIADEAPTEQPSAIEAAAEPVSAEETMEESRAELPLGEEPAAADIEAGERTPETPPGGPAGTDDTASPDDVFRGERPALRLVENEGRRQSDKVVQLQGRRSRSIFEGLSSGEQAAFREIARQLGESFGKRRPEDRPAEPSGVQSPEAQGTGQQEDARTSSAPSAGDLEEMPGLEIGQHADDMLPAENAAVAPPRTSMEYGLTAAVVDALPVALLVHAGDRLVHANPEFFKLTEYSSLERLEAAGGIDALLQSRDLDDGEPDGTMLLRRADGTAGRVRARLQSIRWEDGTSLMLALSPAQAATAEPQPQPAEESDERNAEQIAFANLRVEADELRSILETATDGVVIVGQEGEIRSMNRSASALFNYDDEETQGKPFAMLFAHESQKAVLDYLAGLSGHGVASVLNDGREVIGREASGGFIPLFMTMGRLSSSSGYCAVIRDITQWKRTEEELRSAKRAAETANAHKSDFLARVSHEIRTPLNAIIGFSDMMATERFGPIGHSRYVEYANDIGRSGRHVLDIVNDLLDISKIEAGEMDLEFTAVGLNETVAEAVSLVQPQANSQRVIIRTSLSASVPQVVADLRSVKQIALNILSNAIRFTPSGGQIVVSTAYEANGSVVLRIRDTGVGMTRSELEQAMKPFRQVTTGARKRGDGTGLGLPLTKAMVDANRANFSISSAPNEGTLVEVVFPSPRVLAD
ncbi:MAG: histidine kinase dimerization/phospho-acceptor domain-containing protein [Shinella sp.]|nr:histidine kinase dimerization/phospho-acceptor domain-containing protein [Shinella sp.]